MAGRVGNAIARFAKWYWRVVRTKEGDEEKHYRQWSGM
jgi:hypothetical protein